MSSRLELLSLGFYFLYYAKDEVLYLQKLPLRLSSTRLVTKTETGQNKKKWSINYNYKVNIQN